MRKVLAGSACPFILLLTLTAACATAPGGTSPGPAAGPTNEFATRAIARERLASDVSVRIYVAETESGPHRVPCWAYVTEGLAQQKHPELAVSVKRESGEAENAFPRDVLELLAALADNVREGKHLRAWQSLGFPAGLLGRKDFTGVLTVPLLVPHGIHVESPALSLLIVTSDELQVAKSFGVPRVSSLLGSHHRFFPTAMWADRKRPSLCSPRDLAQSPPARAGRRLWLPTASVWQQVVVRDQKLEGDASGLPNSRVEADGRVILRLAPSAGQTLVRELEETGNQRVLAILMPPAPEANARLVWKPGAQEIMAITDLSLNPQRLAGNFLVLLPSDATRGAVTVEDGFTALFSPAEWKTLKQALASHQPYFSPGKERGLPFEVRWAPETGDVIDVQLSTPMVPPGVRYKTAPHAVNLAAKQKLEHALRKTAGKRNLGAILGDTVICGPFLWERIKNAPGIEEVGLASTFAVPGDPKNGPKILQSLEGRTFRSAAEVASLERALYARFAFDDEFTVRKAGFEELALIWALVPFDIEEPLFVAESKRYRFLAAFVKDGSSVMWIDDLQDLSFDHGRLVKAKRP